MSCEGRAVSLGTVRRRSLQAMGGRRRQERPLTPQEHGKNGLSHRSRCPGTGKASMPSILQPWSSTNPRLTATLGRPRRGGLRTGPTKLRRTPSFASRAMRESAGSILVQHPQVTFERSPQRMNRNTTPPASKATSLTLLCRRNVSSRPCGFGAAILTNLAEPLAYRRTDCWGEEFLFT